MAEKIDYKVFTAATRPAVGYVVTLLELDFSSDRNREIYCFTFFIRFDGKLALSDSKKLRADNIPSEVISDDYLVKLVLEYVNGLITTTLDEEQAKSGGVHNLTENLKWETASLSAIAAPYLQGIVGDDDIKMIMRLVEGKVLKKFMSDLTHYKDADANISVRQLS